MPSRLQTIDKTVDSIVNALQSKADTSTLAISSFVRGELVKLVKTADGKIDLQDTKTLTALKRINSMILTKVKSSGYEELAKGLKNDLVAIVAPYNTIYSDAIGEELNYDINDIPRLQSIAKQTYEELGGKSKLITTDIKNLINKTLLGKTQSFNALADAIEGKLSSYKSAAYSIANTGVMKASRSVNADIAEIVGIEWFFYVGNRDRKNRPFCKFILDNINPNTQEPNPYGKYWRREDIEKLDNKQIPNPFISGGGHNCRHQWSPVSLLLNKQLNKQYRFEEVV